MPDPLLQVEGLVKLFRPRAGVVVRAVDGVSFEIQPGETLGLVGESGSGKSTLGRSILRLVEPDAGRVLWRGRDILPLPTTEMRTLRREMQIVFQDPLASLNPRMKAGDLVGEGLAIHGLARGREQRDRVRQVMEEVGLGPDQIDRYPHELSGGQRQRIGIARALALQPAFIVADEPLSSLDVSVQAQILNLLSDLRERRGLTFLFIAHDLRVIEHVSDRVAVMYRGRLVEMAPAAEFLSSPQHPYSRALLQAVPEPDPGKARPRLPLAGEPPDALDSPKGCAFHPRCPLAIARCREESPSLTTGGHQVACFRAGEIGSMVA
jgi:oligopeptide/dipeptide ABC transporter ATP-binding protein